MELESALQKKKSVSGLWTSLPGGAPQHLMDVKPFTLKEAAVATVRLRSASSFQVQRSERGTFGRQGKMSGLGGGVMIYEPRSAGRG